jgi:integrase
VARPKKDFPERKAHISGQDRVYLDGSYHYLGPCDSAEAIAKYDALILRYLSNGRKLPKEEPTHHGELPITVAEITAEYRRQIDLRPKQLSRYRHLCTLLEDEYGGTPADQFGPVKLSELRDLLVATGNARQTINEYVRRIGMIFKHAASREMIALDVFSRLQTLEPLRLGQTTAREYKQRQPARIEDVRAAAAKLSPQARAIIAVQLSTAMRPSEVFAIRPMDIDRSRSEWFYRPVHHKTERYGIVKAIPIVGAARLAIEPFLDRPDDQYLFSPAESSQWHRDQRSAARKTPKSCGNRVGTNRKANPKRKPGTKFNKDSLNNSVKVACKKANVARWTPYQLRHLAATTVADALGMGGARALLGHSSERMTRRYVHMRQEESAAIQAALTAPSI